MAGLFRCKKHKIQLNQDEAKERGMNALAASPDRPEATLLVWPSRMLVLSWRLCTSYQPSILTRRRTSIFQPCEDSVTYLGCSMSISELIAMTAHGT